ncbi:DUF5986 family protein [Lachnospiraceae bacterium C1.1]|nr:DUF5986 family protein [Lachnospiraceae bacterium C1.1]
MTNDLITFNTKSIMIKIGKAIEKGACEDIRTYLENNNNAVNNALGFLRGDYIVTNIRNTVRDNSVEIKYFKRSSWTGCIIIDHTDKNTYSVCAKSTLDRIPKNKNRKKPHYVQTLLNTENRYEEAEERQMTLADFGILEETQFTEEDYRKDFWEIMEETLSIEDNYKHWVVTYEVEHNSLVGVSAVLLNKEFAVVKEISIIDMLKPDFGNLTIEEPMDKQIKDAHSLVSIKPGIIGRMASEKEKHIEILPKHKEETKEV